MTGEAPGAAGHRRLSPAEFRDVIGHFASGVTVITAVHEGTQYGTTASAVSSLSLEPPMLLVCMSGSSATGRAIQAARRFAVNILSEEQPEAAVRFASKAADKFAGVPVTPGEWGEPLLDDALATLECRVVEDVAGGTHRVYLAEVDRANARAGAAPLAYFRGQFGRLELAHDEEAFRLLRDLLLERELPAGEPLRIDRLAAELGLERPAVYHALVKLAGEGLVGRAPEGTFVVPRWTLELVEDALRARVAILLGAVETGAGRVTASSLARLRAALPPHPAADDAAAVGAWLRAYPAFLELVVELAGSAALLGAFRRAGVSLLVAGPGAAGLEVEPAAAELAALVAALEAGDLAAARAAVSDHFERAAGWARRLFA